MGKGSKSSNQPQQVTSTTTTLPEYAKPYVMNVMQGAQGLANQGYVPYTGARIAGFGNDQLNAFDLARDAPNVGQSNFNQADAYNTNAGNLVSGANYNPNQLNSTYQAQPSYGGAQFDGGQWDNNAAQQYMSPYMSQVLDSIMARQENSFGQAQVARNAAAARSGSFGGYRQGVESGVARGQHELNTGDLLARNLNEGYNTAFSQFNADRGRGLQAQDMTERSRQFGAQFNDAGQRAENDYNFQFGNQNNANALDAARQRMAQAEGMGQLGNQTASLGLQRQQANLAGIEALRSTGLDQQRQTQASLDQGYNDFINQRDWQKNQTTWLNNIIRGNVTSANSNTVNTESTNPYTQMLGMGVGAVGLGQALGIGQDNVASGGAG